MPAIPTGPPSVRPPRDGGDGREGMVGGDGSEGRVEALATFFVAPPLAGTAVSFFAREIVGRANLGLETAGVSSFFPVVVPLMIRALDDAKSANRF